MSLTNNETASDLIGEEAVEADLVKEVDEPADLVEEDREIWSALLLTRRSSPITMTSRRSCLAMLRSWRSSPMKVKPSQNLIDTVDIAIEHTSSVLTENIVSKARFLGLAKNENNQLHASGSHIVTGWPNRKDPIGARGCDITFAGLG